MRPGWDEYFMRRAYLTATRATCPKRFVGAVLVRNNREVSSGYNGSRSGAKHCTEVGCLIDKHGSCRRTIHAERNAIATAARHGVNTEGTTCYVNTQPCWDCFQILVQAGVKRVLFCEVYNGFNAEMVRNNYRVQQIEVPKGIAVND